MDIDTDILELEDEYVRESGRADKRRRDHLKKKRAIKLTDISLLAGWTDEDRKYVRNRKCSALEQFYKRVSNRKVRHYKEDLSHGDYKKVFDLWWTLW